MTNRERYFATFRYESLDHPPLMLGGPWPETVRRWQAEGMPAGVDLYDYFGLEPVQYLYIGPSTRMFPAWEEKLLEETETHVTLRTSKGSTVKRCKGMEQAGAEHYLDYPIHGPEDMGWLAEKLDPNVPGRDDGSWRQKLEEKRGRPETILLSDFGSFFGDLHEHMGTEQTLTAFYDHPELIHFYNDKIATLCEVSMDKVLPLGGVDYMGGHEDMAYKGAPMISPAMFREFLMPYYRRTVTKARGYGQWIFMQDCDGDFRLLLPLWLEVGVNGMAPCEVAAGIDVGELRAEYGRELLLSGGIDKRAIAAGKAETKAELEKRYKTAELGGYIPGIDHGVPPDVSWENYSYYVEVSKVLYGIA
jgi:uroporphyrinogen decarboxylase